MSSEQPTISKEDLAFNKVLQKIKRILDVVRGKEDPRNRISVITKPDNLKSSANLSIEQCHGVEDCHWLFDQNPIVYKPLRDLADETCSISLSKEGYGIEKGIQLTAAIEQTAIFKAAYGSTQNQEGKKRRLLPGFRKEETKQ